MTIGTDPQPPAFDYYVGGIKQVVATGQHTVAEAVALIRGDAYAVTTTKLRSADSDARKRIKSTMDYVTWSGTFSPVRHADKLSAHSGLICLDFDHVQHLWETRLHLQGDPHTLVLFTSPSGDGLKLVVAVHDLDKETGVYWPVRHKEAYVDLVFYYRQTYGLEADASGSDVSRACFLPHDPNAFHQPAAEPYTLKGLAEKKPPKPRTEQQVVADMSDVYRHVLAVIERIEAARVDITDGSGNYDTRLMMAFCMSTLGEPGRDLLHRMLAFYPNYTQEETDSKFDQGVQKSRFTTPWLFFKTAQKAGIDISKPKKTKPAEVKPAPTTPPVERVSQKQPTDKQNVDKDDDTGGKTGWHTVNYSRGGISIFGNKNWVRVAENFQLFVKYCTEDEDEEKTWILEVRVSDRPDPLYVEVTHEEFCSATKLKNKLAGYRLALKLTDAYLGELWQHLFGQVFPLAQKVMRLGFHAESGVFFFADKAVNGTVLDPDEFGIVSTTRPDGTPLSLSMPIVKKKRQHLFTLRPGTVTFNQWFGYLVRVHKYDNAVIPACFYLMSLYRDLIVKHTAASPILYLKGGASSGKSSLVRSMCRLFGLHEAVANLKNKNSEVGLVRVMSQVSNAVLWMDEYHNDFPYEGLLQSAYDDNGYIKAQENSTAGVESVDIYSALALTSNFIPDNQVFFSRCVFVPISEQTKTDDQRKAFAEFVELESGGLTSVTLEMLGHRPTVQGGLKEAYNELYESLKEAVKYEKVVERLISNMARVLAPAYVLQVAGKINLHLEVCDRADVLNEFVAIGSRVILRQHQVQTEKTALSEFFEILQNQYEQGFVQEDIHFRLDGSLIYLRFPSLYTIYAQRYRGTFWKAPADRDVLRAEMIGFEGGADPEKFFRNIRFSPGDGDDGMYPTRSVSGSCAMTYSKLVEAFGMDLRGKRIERT